MPLLRMAMYANGVQIYCARTADDQVTWLPTLLHFALEGRCFWLVALADGQGGRAGGRNASQLACDTVNDVAAAADAQSLLPPPSGSQ